MALFSSFQLLCPSEMFSKQFDEHLLALARYFETGGEFWYRPEASEVREFHYWVSELVDERSVVRDGADAFQFSIIGYAKYFQHINALRQSR